MEHRETSKFLGLQLTYPARWKTLLNIRTEIENQNDQILSFIFSFLEWKRLLDTCITLMMILFTTCALEKLKSKTSVGSKVLMLQSVNTPPSSNLKIIRFCWWIWEIHFEYLLKKQKTKKVLHGKMGIFGRRFQIYDYVS